MQPSLAWSSSLHIQIQQARVIFVSRPLSNPRTTPGLSPVYKRLITDPNLSTCLEDPTGHFCVAETWSSSPLGAAADIYITDIALVVVSAACTHWLALCQQLNTLERYHLCASRGSGTVYTWRRDGWTSHDGRYFPSQEMCGRIWLWKWGATRHGNWGMRSCTRLNTTNLLFRDTNTRFHTA